MMVVKNFKGEVVEGDSVSEGGSRTRRVFRVGSVGR